MWYGIDYDETLVDKDGQPNRDMVDKVNHALGEGKDVRIFTARVTTGDVSEVKQFCRDYFGTTLPVTNKKDPECAEIWDDAAVNPIEETSMLQGIGQLAGTLKEGVVKGTKKLRSGAKSYNKSKFHQSLGNWARKLRNA